MNKYLISYQFNGRPFFWNGVLDVNEAEIYSSEKIARLKLDRLIEEHKKFIKFYQDKLDTSDKSTPSLYNDFIAQYQEFIDTAKIQPVKVSVSITESLQAFSDAQQKAYNRLIKILDKSNIFKGKYLPRKSIDGSNKISLSMDGKDFININKNSSFEILKDGKTTGIIDDIDDFSDNEIGVILKKELSVMESSEDSFGLTGAYEAMGSQILDNFRTVLSSSISNEGSISTITKLSDFTDLNTDFKEELYFIKNAVDLTNTTEVVNLILNSAETLLSDYEVETLIDLLSPVEDEEGVGEYKEPEDWSMVDQPDETDSTDGEPEPEE